MNTEVVAVGCKLYIISRTDKETHITTVGEGSKIENRKYKSWFDVPSNERFQIFLAKMLEKHL